MWFVYLDESKESNNVFVYSALIVDSAQWTEAFHALKEARMRLRQRRENLHEARASRMEIRRRKGEDR